MTYVLKRSYKFTDEKTGKMHHGDSYHVDVAFGLPMGSSRIADARTFRTKVLAEVYARNKLPGRGYKPFKLEKVAT